MQMMKMKLTVEESVDEDFKEIKISDYENSSRRNK